MVKGVEREKTFNKRCLKRKRERKRKQQPTALPPPLLRIFRLFSWELVKECVPCLSFFFTVSLSLLLRRSIIEARAGLLSLSLSRDSFFAGSINILSLFISSFPFFFYSLQTTRRTVQRKRENSSKKYKKKKVVMEWPHLASARCRQLSLFGSLPPFCIYETCYLIGCNNN